ncbi:DUF3945 domain-containing protein [Spirosoma sp. BT702]|uniref:DUF3945 domain-containing protein n=1 Tax=Spirosoma profusum TaxID=2771354 RepID=A0A926Y2T1_9BACT|nr:DUF3945 domain-containing protein [Spirosoma profusum]MBD2703367.1 DUF3945 domain-containing protein [Spirosoma profusum]
METEAINYARSQVDGLDNIAPSLTQGQTAWQYAQTDQFFSLEEQAAVLRHELEPYRAQIEQSLAQIGWGPEHLANHPTVAQALFSGQQTVPLAIFVTPTIKLEGCLRIVMTEHGPDIRVTPIEPILSIPEKIDGIQLSERERQQLKSEGALPRPFLILENGNLVPTYLRVDEQTNTLEFWRVKPEQLPIKLLGIDLTKDQQLQLASGHQVRLSGLLDQQGEPFTASVSVSAARQSLQFSDFNRMDVQLKPDRQFHQQLAHNNEGGKTDQTLSQETKAGFETTSHKQLETVTGLLDKKTEQQSVKRTRKAH